MQLNHSIAGLGFYYLNNRFTNTELYDFDHMTPEALETRRAFMVDFVLRFVTRCDRDRVSGEQA